MSDYPEISSGLDGGDYEHYLVARLALWAGDISEAIRRLKTYAPVRTKGSLEGLDALAQISADRTLRQLRRRISEYNSMKKAAEVESDEIGDRILKSTSESLGGVIWLESEREFELRAYLCDLSLEEDFYRAAKELTKSQGDEDIQNAPVLYGGDATSRDVTDADTSLHLEWVINESVFLQVAVSDFCTFSARGIWTARRLPNEFAEIRDPCQRLLDTIATRMTPRT